MAAAGLRSLFPLSDLSVMGFAEVVPRLPRLAARLHETVREARAAGPALVVGIDSKGFCLRVLAALAKGRAAAPAARAAPSAPALVQYVAPAAWAFPDASARAARLSPAVDELLCILPFESPPFEAAGIPCSYVGHPVLEDAASSASARTEAREPRPAASSSALRDALGLAADETAVCLLPGSRRDEVSANLPHMLEGAERLAGAARPSLLLLPTLPSLRPQVEARLRARPEGSIPAVVVDAAERYASYGACRLAIACSGTVSLELALSRTPQLVVYRSSRLTSWVVRHWLQPTTE